MALILLSRRSARYHAGSVLDCKLQQDSIAGPAIATPVARSGGGQVEELIRDLRTGGVGIRQARISTDQNREGISPAGGVFKILTKAAALLETRRCRRRCHRSPRLTGGIQQNGYLVQRLF